MHLPARCWHLPPTLSPRFNLAVALFTVSAHLPGCVPAKELLYSMLIDPTLKISSLEASVVFDTHSWLPPQGGAKCTASVFLVYDLVEKTDKHKHKSPWYQTNWKVPWDKTQGAEGHMAEGRERFISTQAIISSKDKEIWWILVWLTRLFFSLPKGLGSVNQITVCETGLSQGTDHAEEAGLPHLCCAACCLLLLFCTPGRAWLGVCLPSEGVMCCISKCLALCSVYCSVIIWRNLFWGLTGSPGQSQF